MDDFPWPKWNGKGLETRKKSGGRRGQEKEEENNEGLKRHHGF